jgi:hypothetical protein
MNCIDAFSESRLPGTWQRNRDFGPSYVTASDPLQFS